MTENVIVMCAIGLSLTVTAGFVGQFLIGFALLQAVRDIEEFWEDPAGLGPVSTATLIPGRAYESVSGTISPIGSDFDGFLSEDEEDLQAECVSAPDKAPTKALRVLPSVREMATATSGPATQRRGVMRAYLYGALTKFKYTLAEDEGALQLLCRSNVRDNYHTVVSLWKKSPLAPNASAIAAFMRALDTDDEELRQFVLGALEYVTGNGPDDGSGRQTLISLENYLEGLRGARHKRARAAAYLAVETALDADYEGQELSVQELDGLISERLEQLAQ